MTEVLFGTQPGLWGVWLLAILFTLGVWWFVALIVTFGRDRRTAEQRAADVRDEIAHRRIRVERHK